MVKKNRESSPYAVPYLIDFERLALDLLKTDEDGKEELKELLEKYADKYAKEDTFGT